jgi:hypothetical protein
MTTHEATFEIDSKTDAYAVRKILEQTYNTVREESRSIREGSDDADELLAAFGSLKDASEQHAPGRLTITYEVEDREFE